MSKQSSAFVKIIEAISAPLGFFVLALLIVESFLATVLLGSSLEKSDVVVGMYVGVGLFVFVTLAVFVLVWFKPEHLTYDREAHLINAGKLPFGSDEEEIDPEDRFNARRVRGGGDEG